MIYLATLRLIPALTNDCLLYVSKVTISMYRREEGSCVVIVFGSGHIPGRNISSASATDVVHEDLSAERDSEAPVMRFAFS